MKDYQDELKEVVSKAQALKDDKLMNWSVEQACIEATSDSYLNGLEIQKFIT